MVAETKFFFPLTKIDNLKLNRKKSKIFKKKFEIDLKKFKNQRFF